MPYKEHKWKKPNSSSGPKEISPQIVNMKRMYRSKDLAYMAWNKTREMIYITDRNEALIKSLDKNFNVPLAETIVDGSLIVHGVYGKNPNQVFEKPVAICINSRGDVFIGDHGEVRKGKLVILDSFLNFIKSIEDSHLTTPSCMEIEDCIEEKNAYKLYVTDWFCSNFNIFKLKYQTDSQNYESEFMASVNVISPSSIRLTKEYIFVVSETSWEWVRDPQTDIKRRKIEKISKGLNAVILFDKNTFEELKIIQLVDWLNPRGLYVDSDLNIYTTAYKLEKRSENDEKSATVNTDNSFLQLINEFFGKEGTEKDSLISKYHASMYNGRTFSDDMYLIVHNKKGDLLQETKLGFDHICDFLVFENDNKIMFMSGRTDPAVHVLEFCEPII